MTKYNVYTLYHQNMRHISASTPTYTNDDGTNRLPQCMHLLHVRSHGKTNEIIRANTVGEEAVALKTDQQ